MEHFPERKRIRLSRSVYRQDHAFFITIRTYQGYPWFRLHRELADFAAKSLVDISTDRETMLYSWCIMLDHIHLLFQDRDIVDFVRLFKGRMTAKAFDKEPTRRLWQRSFFDHAMRKEENLHEKALYIWENPVRAGLVDDPVKYAWSGSKVWPNWKEFSGGDKPRPYI